MPHQKQPLPLALGDFIDSGRLRIVQIIGRGAFGAVYAVQELDTSTLYAVKCLFPKRKSSKGEPVNVQTLFQHEVSQHSAASGHRNVLTLHRHFTESDLHFLVFDLCMGSDLLSNITCKPLFWKRDDLIKDAILQIVDGVAHCHSRGIAHRDLKPENILADEDGTNFVISDFGLATNRTTSVTHGIGSKYYKSPECALAGSSQYNTRVSDIWAIGIILINIITGRVPWVQAHPDDEHYSSYVQDRDYLLEYMPLSHELMRVLKRALEPQPSLRISIAELREGISQLEHFHATDDELARAPDLARSVMADRAALLEVSYTLPPRVTKTPRTPTPLFTPKRSSPAWRASPNCDDVSPSVPRFGFSAKPAVVELIRAISRGPSKRYLPFTLDVGLRDNTARRLSLPRLVIAM